MQQVFTKRGFLRLTLFTQCTYAGLHPWPGFVDSCLWPGLLQAALCGRRLIDWFSKLPFKTDKHVFSWTGHAYIQPMLLGPVLSLLQLHLMPLQALSAAVTCATHRAA